LSVLAPIGTALLGYRVGDIIEWSTPGGDRRLRAPFVPVACGAIPEGLLESELFGHVKGGVHRRLSKQDGFFQAAENGSIFLDEISETTPSTQTKLLRVLQDREIYLVGESRAEASRYGGPSEY